MLATKVFTSQDTAAEGAGDAVGVPKKHWFIASVAHNTEKISRDRLKDLGYESYVASQKETRKWKNGKKKEIERIVISNYVFVRVTELERRHVVNLPFIKSFLTNRAGKLNEFGHRPLARIPDNEMLMLRRMLDDDELVHFTSSDFALGDTVRILGWGEDVFRGRVVRLFGDDASYVGIRIENLGCAYMEISPSKLELVR